MVQHHAPLGRAVPDLQSDARCDEENEQHASVNAANEIAQGDHDTRRERQLHFEPVEQSHENRHHLPEQQGDNHGRDEQHGHRIDQRGLHGALQFDVFLDVGREPLENGVENTARLARLDHVVVERVKNFVVLLHRGRQRRTALDRTTHAIEYFLERFVFLLPSENFQTLYQREAGVNHHGKLACEDGQFFCVHACSKGGDVEFLSLLRELADVDLLPAEYGSHFGFAGRGALTGDCSTRPIDSTIRIYRHDLLPPVLLLPPDGNLAAGGRRGHPTVN